MIHWYAAIVKRQREQPACEALQTAGFVAYVPMEEVQKRKPRKQLARKPALYEPETVETVEVPVIRGIVIVGSPVDLGTSLGTWWRLMQIRYPAREAPDGRVWQEGDQVVRQIYGNGGVPTAIPERQIAVMLAARDKRVSDLVAEGEPMFAPDADVELLAGAFRGLRATVRELIPGTLRYRAFTELFGGKVSIEVSEVDMRPWAAE